MTKSLTANFSAEEAVIQGTVAKSGNFHISGTSYCVPGDFLLHYYGKIDRRWIKEYGKRSVIWKIAH